MIGVRVIHSSVYSHVVKQSATSLVSRKHSFDCIENYLFWAFLLILFKSLFFETSKVLCMISVDLLQTLLACHLDVVSSDNDHHVTVTSQFLWVVCRLVLSPEEVSCFVSHTTKRDSRDVKHVPYLAIVVHTHIG